MNQNTLRIYFITDSGQMDEATFLHKIEKALQAGVTCLQLREKEKNDLAYYELASKVHKISQAYQVPLIVDDRLDIALAVDAEGVHVGQNDIPIREARRLLGPRKIVGATAKTVRQALQAEQDGADYLGVGAIYPTSTKVKTAITPVDTLHDICQAVRIPVNAIGGLTADNLGILAESGISGVCVVSYLMQAPDIAENVNALSHAIHTLFHSYRETRQ